ncbi:hypothetical protein [Streptomyces eurythermus]|uniref:hypothetical protein n=1 Tax=Streptomyces eurythermus TaxID=42237 RepID=UPI00340440A6
MRIRSVRRAAIAVTVSAACLLSCSTDADDTPQGAGTRDASRWSSAPAPADTGAQEPPATPAPAASPGPERVRDAFAGLQATLDDTSTENLEAHRTELTGVRDRIDSWMQGYPDDYR